MSSFDSSKFTFVFEYQNKDLIFILNSIYKCYLKIIVEEISINNNENDIRDIFISEKYLDNYNLKQEFDIIEYKFDKEIQTKDGRVDIRVLDMIKTMKGEFNPFYYIECKRIKGDKTYNSFYINNGVNRYIEEKYLTHQEANAMIGFVVKSIDIDKNCRYFKILNPYKIIDGFDHSYVSTHITKSQKAIKLYHLMLDFSSKIHLEKK